MTDRSSIHNFPKQAKRPQTVGTAIDMLYTMRTKRLEMEHTVEGLKVREKDMRDHILVLLNKAKLEGAKGKVATAAITERPTFKLEQGGDGWKKFWEWARKDKVGAFVQKRIAVEALGEYVDAAKKMPPGVESFLVVDISLAKR